MLLERLREQPQPDLGEEADRELARLGVFLGKQPRRGLSQARGKQPRTQPRGRHELRKLLEQLLDEDTRRDVRLALRQADVREDAPVDGVGVQQVRVAQSQVAQLGQREVVHSGVVERERVLELEPVATLATRVDFAQPLSERAVQPHVRAFVATAQQHHVGDLALAALAQRQPQQLVRRFLEGERGHDDEVDLATQLHRERAAAVVDAPTRAHAAVRRQRVRRCGDGRVVLMLLLLLLIVRGVGFVVGVVVVVFAEDFGADNGVLVLMLLPRRVALEHVQQRLRVVVAVQLGLVRNLVVQLHQVESRVDGRVGLEPCAVGRKHGLALHLHRAGELALGEDGAEAREDGRVDLPAEEVQQRRANLERKGGREGHGVVGRRLEQSVDDLQCEDFMRDAVVDQVREKGARRGTTGAVATLPPAAELEDEAAQEDVADLGQLRVDDRDERGVDAGERGRRLLCGEQRTAHEAAAADEVFVEKLGNNVRQVVGVGLVDETVDAAPQGLPALALERLFAELRRVSSVRALGGLLLAQHAQFRRRDVNTGFVRHLLCIPEWVEGITPRFDFKSPFLTAAWPTATNGWIGGPGLAVTKEAHLCFPPPSYRDSRYGVCFYAT